MERAPGARDARVFAGRLHGEDGDAAADVDAEVRVRLREVEAPLLAVDDVARPLPVVALVERPVLVDEVDAITGYHMFALGPFVSGASSAII